MMIHSSKSLIIALTLYTLQFMFSEGQLKVGFYNKTCPNAEHIVKSVVKDAMFDNRNILPRLLRLQFHDCFVEGCDGSILIEDVEDPEKDADAHQGVKGFGQIATAKATLEVECPGIVSCADIVVMAARDAVFLAGGHFYEVETGRRDGFISVRSHAANLPDVDDPIHTLISKFKRKGLSEKELVLLTGAHTIGTTACFFMKQRLYDFTGRGDSDPTIDPDFLSKLMDECPEDGDVNDRIFLDQVNSGTFGDRALRNIKEGVAVLASDARLYNNNVTRRVIDHYVTSSSSLFLKDFDAAMVKLGRIGVKTGSRGEIRQVCESFN